MVRSTPLAQHRHGCDTGNMGIDRSKLADRLAAERIAFAEARPASRAAAEEAASHLIAGVPMTWMAKWAGGFPLFLREARGSRRHELDAPCRSERARAVGRALERLGEVEVGGCENEVPRRDLRRQEQILDEAQQPL